MAAPHQGGEWMAASSQREHVSQSRANRTELRLSVRQVPATALRAPKAGSSAVRESVRQSPTKTKSSN